MVDPDDVIYRHHVESRVHLFVPKEETFRISLKYIDVITSTHTDLNVLQDKRVDDYWNVDLNRSLSDSWKGFVKCSSGMSHVPSQPSRVPRPRGMLSRDSGLPHDTRNTLGISGNVSESLPAQERISPSLPSDPKNLTSSHWEGVPGIALDREKGLRREPRSSTKPTPRCIRNYETWNPLYHTDRTYSQNCMMEPRRYAISELHFGKFPDPDDVQCWRVNFKAEERVSTPFPQLTTSWIAEVEMARSIDDLTTSQSIEGRRDFPDFVMRDPRIASALRKIIFNTFLKGESVLKSSEFKNTFDS